MIQSNNSPALSDLDYFSRFTSWQAAFSLVRPGMNAWAQLGSHGSLFSLIWPLGCVMVSVLAAAMIVRGNWRRLNGPLALPVVALASVFLANGAQGVTQAAAHWTYTHIPLAGIFRESQQIFDLPSF